MSAHDRHPLVLARPIDGWRRCEPHAMAHKQSPAAIEFAFIDARHDVLALSDEVDRLRALLDRSVPAMLPVSDNPTVLRRLFDLPLGSLFRYADPANRRTYVLLGRSDRGLVGDAPDESAQRTQGMYSAAESSSDFREMLVELVDVTYEQAKP